MRWTRWGTNLPKCLRCAQTEHLTRSHVPMRFVGRWAFGSLKRAFKQGRIQIYWLCEPCRQEHQILEAQLLRRRMLELASELEELHRRFCGQKGTSETL
jgi:hypothetical protein